MRYNARQVIQEEWNLRLECGDDLCEKYDEWERGFWAARSQCILFAPKNRKMQYDQFFGAREGK